MSADRNSTVQDRLRQLAQAYAIDWEPLHQEVARACDEQSRLEEIAEGHSCEGAGWESVVGDLEQRRTQSLDAIDRVIKELMEIDAPFLAGYQARECEQMLRQLRNAFDRALGIRATSARFILSLAYAAREPEYPDGTIVTSVLNKVMTSLCEVCEEGAQEGRGLSKADALKFTAALAQACSVLAPDLPDPVAALRERLEGEKKQATDIKALFASRAQLAEARLEPGMTFEEITRRTQAIALGLWPDPPPDDSR